MSRNSKKTTNLSVVIVTLGGRKYVPRCLRALQKQTGMPELVVAGLANVGEMVDLIERRVSK